MPVRNKRSPGTSGTVGPDENVEINEESGSGASRKMSMWKSANPAGPIMDKHTYGHCTDEKGTAVGKGRGFGEGKKPKRCSTP